MNRVDPKTTPGDSHSDAERPGRRSGQQKNLEEPAVEFPKNPVEPEDPDDHEGATEEQIGDATGPGAGYDEEPQKTDDKGGVL